MDKTKYILKHVGKGAAALAMMTVTSILEEKAKELFVPTIKEMFK